MWKRQSRNPAFVSFSHFHPFLFALFYHKKWLNFRGLGQLPLPVSSVSWTAAGITLYCCAGSATNLLCFIRLFSSTLNVAINCWSSCAWLESSSAWAVFYWVTWSTYPKPWVICEMPWSDLVHWAWDLFHRAGLLGGALAHGLGSWAHLLTSCRNIAWRHVYLWNTERVIWCNVILLLA